MRLEGEVVGEGDLIVHGHLIGPVRLDGALLVEASGLVAGHVHARSITVRGALKGNAFANDSIRVEAGARLVGDLTAPRVRVIPGARFAGQVHVEDVDVAPALGSYDPTLHTFTGMPAPAPIPQDLASGRSLSSAGTLPGIPTAMDTLSDFDSVADEARAVRSLSEHPPLLDARDTLHDDLRIAPAGEEVPRAQTPRRRKAPLTRRPHRVWPRRVWPHRV